MGTVLTTVKNICEYDNAKAVSREIDREIFRELKKESDEIEILILGAPESGKSTLLKQVLLLNWYFYIVLPYVFFV